MKGFFILLICTKSIAQPKIRFGIKRFDNHISALVLVTLESKEMKWKENSGLKQPIKDFGD